VSAEKYVSDSGSAKSGTTCVGGALLSWATPTGGYKWTTPVSTRTGHATDPHDSDSNGSV
jgi:hypothetical protein